MLKPAPSLWLPFAAIVLFLAPIVIHANKADAIVIPVIDYGVCNPSLGWRCFGTERTLVTTTFDQPDANLTITPIFPDDPANWRLRNVTASYGPNVTYGFVFPTVPGPIMGARLDELSFTDSQGRAFVSIDILVGDTSCSTNTFPGKWYCSEGNGFYGQWQFGEFNGAAYAPVDPILPSLDGAITIHLDWTIIGTDVPEPESSYMNVNGLYLSYNFEPIPEPSTGLLVTTGLLGIAYRRRALRRFRLSLPETFA